MTHITPEKLAKMGARPFREILPQFLSWLAIAARRGSRGGGGGGGVILVAHKASFDRGFLEHEMERAGIDKCVNSRACGGA